MKKKHEQSGMVLVALVLSVGLFALGSTLVVTSGIMNQVAKNQNTTSGHQTFYTAEAAAASGALDYLRGAVYTLKPLEEEGLLNDTEEGEITVTEDNFDEYIAQLESGTLGPNAFYCAGPCRRVSATVSDEKSERRVSTAVTTFPAGMAFNYAAYAENNLKISGNTSITGNVFANGTVTLPSGSGNNAEIDGNVISPNEVDDSGGHLTGETYTVMNPIPAPEVDITPYEVEAIDEDTYFDDVSEAEAFLEDTKKKEQIEAHVFVASSDDMQVQNTNLLGSLVTSGDLTLSGGTYTASEDHLALIVQGNLTLSGNVTIEGVVYVTGTTSFGSGTTTINGSLISANGTGTADVNGNVTITYDPAVVEDLYDENGIKGLNTGDDDTTEVAIVDWSES